MRINISSFFTYEKPFTKNMGNRGFEMRHELISNSMLVINSLDQFDIPQKPEEVI